MYLCRIRRTQQNIIPTKCTVFSSLFCGSPKHSLTTISHLGIVLSSGSLKFRANMESEGGQRGGSSSPVTMLVTLMAKREKLQDELHSIEKQVYELETSYLQDSSPLAHVLKGFEGFLSSSKTSTNLKRSKKFQPEDRLFSLSSVTSPAAEELKVGRDDGRFDFGPGRYKGGALPANGQGKPKKGRISTGPRDVKRIRQSSEAEFEDDDDPELNLR